MTDCPDCLSASTSHTWGGTQEGCEGCEIREVAKMPKHFRQQRYADWSKRYGEDEMQRRRLAVVAEYKRIDGLRSK